MVARTALTGGVDAEQPTAAAVRLATAEATKNLREEQTGRFPTINVTI
jgi:hypothetical protein